MPDKDLCDADAQRARYTMEKLGLNSLRLVSERKKILNTYLKQLRNMDDFPGAREQFIAACDDAPQHRQAFFTARHQLH